MSKIKILLFFAVQGRPDITKICVAGINRLKRELKGTFDIQPFAVYSEVNDGKLLKELKIPSTKYKNLPLGAKMNHGLRTAYEKYDFDYFVHIGSDDLLSSKIFELYKPYFEQNISVIGIDRCHFYNPINKQKGKHINGYMIGGGRCLSKDFLENISTSITVRLLKSISSLYWSGVKGDKIKLLKKEAQELIDGKLAELVSKETKLKLWPNEKNSALDAASHIVFLKNRIQTKIIDTLGEICLVSIKSEKNIHSFDELKSDSSAFTLTKDNILKFVSKKELEMIKSLV
jgi:hypothetical protein